jgi:photosystem II stability/assembly factor-like uncharacterized protein
MAIALTHAGPNMYRAKEPSSEVLVGTTDGIVAIRREGADWRVADHVLGGSHVSAIVSEPRSGLTFASAFKGGIHCSADGGETWERREEGLTELDVYSLAVRDVDGRVRLFVGTQPSHLFCSDDLGKSWTDIPSLREVPSFKDWSYPGPPHIAHVKHINFAPDDPYTIYAAIEQGALLRSRDDGATWEDLHVPYEDIHRTVIDPRNPAKILVTGGQGIWGTTDGGATWANWATKDHELGGYPDQLVFLPGDPDTMIVAAGRTSPGTWARDDGSRTRISRSTDGGRTWEVLHNGLPDLMQPSVEAMCVEETEDGRVSLFAATVGGEVLLSENRGDSWSVIVRGLPIVAKGPHRRFTQFALA